MQDVSALYTSIVAGEHWFECFLRVYLTAERSRYVDYAESQIISAEIENAMFDASTPALGKALAGTLTVSMLNPSDTIPRMAECRPRFCACRKLANGTVEKSEYLQKGVYWIDTREVTKTDENEVLTFTAYDAMLKAEQDFPSTTHAWPAVDTTVLNDISRAMGVGVDPRTTAAMTNRFSIPAMAGYTCREALGLIAAYYGGNFVMSDTGSLLLVQIGKLARETNYLTRSSSALVEHITIGGDKILIEEASE